MSFKMPVYHPPDFACNSFATAPNAAVAPCESDGTAPVGFHATSIFPEYFKVDGRWLLAADSRMDCAVVLREGNLLDVVELRRLRTGDKVVLGRSEDGSEGIYLHANGFDDANTKAEDKFSFRSGRSRETAFTQDYDHLCQLLEYEREHGRIVWVLGPALSFDYSARRAMQALVDGGYLHGLLAGNALATHDLEAGWLRTALGQDIYTQQQIPGGHYHHLDLINTVRRSGSIPAFIEQHNITDGIIHSLVKRGADFVLTSSIRDDGPLPEVIHSAYEGQDAMRSLLRGATTIICIASQLHTIATGNMSPSFRLHGGVVRPLFFYNVDISEFAAGKLRDRGSLSSVGIVTNAQDFVRRIATGLNIC